MSREALISRQILNRGAIEVVQKDRKRVFEQFGMPLKHHQCDRLFHRARVGRFGMTEAIVESAAARSAPAGATNVYFLRERVSARHKIDKPQLSRHAAIARHGAVRRHFHRSLRHLNRPARSKNGSPSCVTICQAAFT